VPAVLTLIVAVVAPVLHLMLPLHPVALNVAVSVLHKLFLLVLITGAAGVLPVVITTTLLAPLSPHAFAHVAV
jgi:hypothetical protein